MGQPRSCVIWLTGLSGAGKTTIALRLCDKLRKRGAQVEHLDGDALRAQNPTGFSREEREKHILRAGELARSGERNGAIVVVSIISPYRSTRRKVREFCGRFVEVYVSTPLTECERRDVKGLYAAARAGLVECFTGVDAPYEAPLQPEVTIDTRYFSPDQAADRILEYMWQTEVHRGRSPS